MYTSHRIPPGEVRRAVLTFISVLASVSLVAAVLALSNLVRGLRHSVEEAQHEGRATRRSLDSLEQHLRGIEEEIVKARSSDSSGATPGVSTILLVEDEPALRELGVETLKELGYRVFTAQDGIEAVDAYRAYRSQVDLVILDLGLPRQGGRQTLTRLREINPGVRVLIASGSSPEADGTVEEMLPLADGFLGKPYRLDAMAHAVHAALERQRPST